MTIQKFTIHTIWITFIISKQNIRKNTSLYQTYTGIAGEPVVRLILQCAMCYLS